MAALITLLGALWAADENGYEYVSEEGYLELSLSIPEGTTEVTAGAGRTAVATVTRRSWEVWTHPETGESITKNDHSDPVPLASVSFTATTVNGSALSVPAGGSTDWQGVWSAGFSMAETDLTVQATATDGNGATASASVSLTAPAPEEIWSSGPSEGLLRATLSTSSGTDSVPYGAQPPLQLLVEYETWEVETSNFGNTRTTNHATSTAAGASVIWTVSGDGSVSGDTTTASDGQAWGTFTMGSSASEVSVSVTYGGGDAASASLTFQPPVLPQPYVVSSSVNYSVSLDVDTVNNAAPGSAQNFGGYVYLTYSEVWDDGYGNLYTSNSFGPYAATGVSLTAQPCADLALSSVSATTDSSGRFDGTVTMGSQASSLLISVAGETASLASVTFVPPGEEPPQPYYLRSDTRYVMDLPAPDSSVSAGGSKVFTGTLSSYTEEVWTDGITEWVASGTATQPLPVPDGTEVVLTLTSGNGTLQLQSGYYPPGAAATVATNGGSFSGTVVMDQSPTALNVTAVMLADAGVSRSITFSPDQTTYKLRDETVYSIQADSPQTVLELNQTATFSGQLNVHTREIWTNGSSEWEQNASSPTPVPDGTEVLLQLTSGNGFLLYDDGVTQTTSKTVQTAFGAFSTLVGMPGTPGGFTVSASVVADPAATVTAAFVPPEETWETTGTTIERSLSAWSSVYQGGPGMSAEVKARVSDVVWLQQTSNYGSQRTILQGDGPVSPSGVAVQFSLQNSSGSLTSYSGTTDERGEVTTSYAFGSADNTVEISAASADSSAPYPLTAALTFTYTPEIWTEWTEQNTVNIQISPIPALTAGQQTSLTASVSYQSFRTRTSNWGGFQREDIATGAAIGAPVTFSAGGGSVICNVPEGEPQVTDSTGSIGALFTMGTIGDATMSAISSYLGASSSSTVSVDFDPAAYLYSDSELVVELKPPAYPHQALETKVVYHQWEVWQKNGVWEVRNDQYSPAIGAEINLVFAPGGIAREHEGATGSTGKWVTDFASADGVTVTAHATFLELNKTANYTVATGTGILDADGDGLTSAEELLHGTNPWFADSDGDGVPDGVEADMGLDPLRGDSDSDGVPDGVELLEGSTPGGVGNDPYLASVRVFSFVPDACVVR